MKNPVAFVLLMSGAMFAQHYSSGGGLALPDYRKWVYLGSGLGMSYTQTSRENPPFTNVFAEPSAYDKFMKTGTWLDRTVLIAEMRESATNISINKSGRVQTMRILTVEAEVKDAATGGWEFYGFENGTRAGKLFAKSAACYSCHQEHAATDNTFVQFYPTLIETAKQHGTFKER